MYNNKDISYAGFFEKATMSKNKRNFELEGYVVYQFICYSAFCLLAYIFDVLRNLLHLKKFSKIEFGMFHMIPSR